MRRSLILLSALLLGLLAHPLAAQIKRLRVAPRISGRLWRPVETLTFAAGRGIQQLGISPGADDERPRGPSAIAFGREGLMVIDGENGRALRLVSGRAPVAVTLPRARNIADLVPAEGGFVVFDAMRNRVMHLDEDGQTQDVGDEVKDFSGFLTLPKSGVVMKTRVGAIGVRTTATAVVPRQTQLTKGVARPKVKAQISVQLAQIVKAVRGVPIAEGRYLSTVRLDAKKARVAIRTGEQDDSPVTAVLDMEPPVPGDIGSVTQLGIDGRGRIYLRLEVLVKKQPVTVRRFVRVLDDKLTLLDDIELPLDGVILPDKDIAIGEDGSIALLLPFADRTYVLRLAPP